MNTIEKWLNGNELGIKIWNNKYRFKDETFDNWLDRLSFGDDEMRQVILDKKFLYGGRMLANLNTGSPQNIANCLALGYVEDSVEGIMNKAKEMALAFQKEAGVGVFLSDIRPKGSMIKSSGRKSDGIIGVMNILASVTENISRGTNHRGATLMAIHADHPDVLDFINIKKNNKGSTGLITGANLSVLVTDEFMRNYKDRITYRKDYVVKSTGEVIPHMVDTVKIMEAIADTPKTSFEPAIIYENRYNDNHLFGNAKEMTKLSCNACFTGDMKLLTKNGYMRFDKLVGAEPMIINSNGNITKSKVLASGIKDVYEITPYGIKCTEDHVFMTIDGKEVKAKDLVGKRIKPFIYNDIKSRDIEFVKFGFIQGDGGTGRLDSDVHKKMEVYIGDRDGDIYDLFNIENETYQSNKRSYYVDVDMEKMKELGFSSEALPKRVLPTTYESWDISKKASFLTGLYSANGYALLKARRIGFKTSCKDLANQLLDTLKNDFGISAYITTNKPKAIAWSNGNYISKESYDVNISAYESRVAFMERIGFINEYKNEIALESIVSQSKVVKELKYIGKEVVYDFTEPEVHFGVVNGYVAHNCSEFFGVKYASCNLGSINLDAIFGDDSLSLEQQYTELKRVTRLAIKYLDKAIDYSATRQPFPEVKEATERYRGIGLGVFGLASMFVNKGIRYGSHESKVLAMGIMNVIKNTAIETSRNLAHELGQPQGIIDMEAQIERDGGKVKYKGLRNASLLSIAPTGTISNLLGLSGGVEPIFRKKYTRKVESFGDEPIYFDIIDKTMKNHICGDGEFPSYCVDASDIDPIEKVELMGAIQMYVDLAMSNTTNLPEDTKIEDIRELYNKAYNEGLVGLSIYVDGSLEGVLNDSKPVAIETDELKRGEIKKQADDTVYYKRRLNVGCGSLNMFVGYSASEGAIQDFYVVKKGNGGCSSNITAVAISMSTILRLGGNLGTIEDSIKGISGCTSFAVNRTNTSKGNTCASAILNILKEFNKDSIEIRIPDMPVKETGNKCPECGEQLIPDSGCYSCTCGYSKCS